MAPQPEKKKCITIGDKRICLEDFGNKKNDDDDDADDKPKKTGNICEGEVACPPGYVVLDKPNKYGACCEPKEGLPAPKPTEAEKCKFGMVGTPPNCEMPVQLGLLRLQGVPQDVLWNAVNRPEILTGLCAMSPRWSHGDEERDRPGQSEWRSWQQRQV
jgi:hypothetical protein